MDHYTLFAIVACGAATVSGAVLVFFGLQVRASDSRITALEAELAKSGEAASANR